MLQRGAAYGPVGGAVGRAVRGAWCSVWLLGAALAGCGEAQEEPDSGADDAGVGELDAGPMDAGEADAGGPTDAGVAADAGAGSASVEWLIEPEPLTISTDLALDYFYSYSLAIDGNPLEYGLRLERCVQLAGAAEQCTSEPRDNLPGESGLRWGLDPFGYAVGENRYRFRLVLERGTTVIDEAEITLVVTVTSCETCVGS